MRKKILSLLSCPNNLEPGFKVFAATILRNGEIINNIEDDLILPEDDIKTGVAVSLSSHTSYPVSDFVGVFLSDADIDKGFYKTLYDPLLNNVPDFYNEIIQDTLNRIYGKAETGDGNWNRDEMKYYDAAVATEELRMKMLHSIQETLLWRIFLPRKENIIDKISASINGQNVLEIGCGNSRTIARVFNPSQNNYNYVGTDISFKRLLVARSAIPEGDFIQASALNLPFKSNSFKAVISFGMLHHLPRHIDAIVEADKKMMEGGLFAFHEPVYTSRSFSEKQSKLARKIFRTYEHSSHDNKINLDASLSTLKLLHHTIINKVPYNSVFRVAFESVLKKTMKNWRLNKTFVKAIIAADHFLLLTVCKISNKLGPQAIIIVSQKNI